MANAKWYEDENGEVERRYWYVKDASDDMGRAQSRGWRVISVTKNGAELRPSDSRAWWLDFLFGPRLVELRDGSIDFRIWPRFRGGRLGWLEALGSMIAETVPDEPMKRIEVEYKRGQ